MIGFLFISFIAGTLTVLAPCILPLLPVIIGGSVSGGKNNHKSYVIIASLVVSIVLFTLLLKWSTAFINIPQEVWKYVSGIILIVFSATMIFPGAWEKLPFVSRFAQGSNKLFAKGFKKKSIWGDVILGASLGPVFSSCSPTYFVILATVLPASFGKGVLYLFAYALGLGLVLLLISLLGQKLTTKLGGISGSGSWFKKSIGILFLLVGLFIITGLDKKFQTYILEKGFFDVTKVEQKISEKIQEKKTNLIQKTEQEKSMEKSSFLQISEKQKKYKQYKELTGIAGYVNTEGTQVTIGEHIGKKIVLIDILTYSCINCQRTFPYVESWYKKYEDDGLIVIGVHTPEFGFEKVQKNVEDAMKKYGITFPVVLDNDYKTWNAYENNYWPRKYLIDIDGFVVYDHIGEGGYKGTEEKIVELLNERSSKLGSDVVEVSIPATVTSESVNTRAVQSPETYLGTARTEYEYTGPNNSIPKMRYRLTGNWKKENERIVSLGNGSLASEIQLNFTAGKVILVAQSKTPVNARILLDNHVIEKNESGVDVKSGVVNFGSARSYELVSLSTPGQHVLSIQAPVGLELYAFTFGQ